jgi:Kdo2-lipid IVA lauroyltransferase/acyltransferase
VPATIRYRIEASAARAVAALATRVPEPAWPALAASLGTLVYAAAAGRRRVALRNLAHVYPGLALPVRQRIARQSFVRLVLGALEVLGGALRPGGALGRVEARGVDVLQAAQAAGRGIVLVASHLGNWELLGAATAQLGFPHRTVGKRLGNPLLTEWIGQERVAAGMQIEWAGVNATMRLMQHLEQCGVVSLVTDQDARGKGVAVSFLGLPVSAHRGAATLALLASSPVVAATIVRDADVRRHRIEYTRVRTPEPTGSLAEDVARLTQAYTDHLGARILKHPEDYLWAHNRFKHLRDDGT